MEDLSGIRQELEDIWGLIDELKLPPKFVGTQPGQSGDAAPEEDQMPFEARLRRARESGDMLSALRVKQEAARAGIVLL
ncbi:MAG: hypothetical protein FWE08_00025 [Oscillospiraceae bacterium]|nr:hypothetical protein [Oscillospiraceae bacterium]